MEDFGFVMIPNSIPRLMNNKRRNHQCPRLSIAKSVDVSAVYMSKKW
jgi:hypothetical protein